MTARWLTWANLLTAGRLATIPALVTAMAYQDWWVAAVLFAFAVVTDVYDGKLARRFNHVSPLGGLFDHATDATLATLGCYALSLSGIANPYLPWLIAAAFLQYVLDSRALAGRTLRASTLGRINGVAYFAFVGTAIGIYALNLPVYLVFLSDLLAAFAWLLVATSLISMGERLLALFQR